MTQRVSATPRTALVAAAAALAGSLALSATSALTGLPLPTTLEDFRQPGTQPMTITQVIQSSQNCDICHGNYNVNQEPYTRWASSMMAQATRDPVFHAALAIANQDANDSGELCLRCHAPGAWLDGRSVPSDGSALDNNLGDFDGVTCHLCHRLVDPFYDPGTSPPVDQAILAALAQLPTSIGNGMYVIDPDDVRRGPFDLGPNFFYHDWLQSPFHRESLLCATCHDVSNPAMTKQANGSYAVNALNRQHPTHDKYQEFPVERTWSEWSKSIYAIRPIETNGRFGGNDTAVSSCQDCHMPTTNGTACQPVLSGAVRNDLPLHDFHGSNSWVLRAVRNLYPDSETGLSAQSVADAHARNQQMLANALDLHLNVRNGNLRVRVVNQTGHKLPTGYPEGRRMWVDVKFYDAGDALLAEHGAYDASTATLTSGDTKVYEAKLGLDAAMAALTGLPAGESFHFVLNNTVLSDNRIPPRGFSNAAFDSVQSKPVGTNVPEQHYWDDTSYVRPLGAVRAEVTVYHQTTTREYIEFLRDANTTNNAGTVAYDQWVATGKSAPVAMKSATILMSSQDCLPRQEIGLSKQLAAGGYPALLSEGSPTVSTNNFAIKVQGGKPGVLGVLFRSPVSATTPIAGHMLYLAPPITRVANFHLDAQGNVTIPIPVTSAMIGVPAYYQAIFRDFQAPSSLGLTNGLHVDYCY
ncbi:MAG: multiheme c-type cytochrome [Planctomycetota bacterium]